MPRFRAPAADGQHLAVPDGDTVRYLIDANRRQLDQTRVEIDGVPLGELRAAARRELLALGDAATGPWPPADPTAPLLLSGHQPELSHPGVWVKNFALCGLAARLGGIAVNLVADTDTPKTTSLWVPTFPDHDPLAARLAGVAFDRVAPEVPYEDRDVLDPELFASLPDRVAPLCENWGFEPLLRRVWPREVPTGARLGEVLVRLRRCQERAWGCHNREVSVSRLSQTGAFRRFAVHVLRDLPRFRAAYNAAIRAYRQANRLRSRNHPAPELTEDEAPFWVRSADGRRLRATGRSDPATLRPRALTLTLFARLVLGDWFVHGIGGGKYDEATDALIRDYFGLEPPAYQVLSATLWLPLPGFATTGDDVRRAAQRVRDLTWNPQRYLSGSVGRDLAARKLDLAAAGSMLRTHRERRAWYRQLREVTDRLRPLVADQLEAARAELLRRQAEVRANAVLRRRDFAWVLYPEARLRPFLQRFLEA